MANAGSSQRQMCSRGVLDSSKTKSYGRSNPQHIQRKSFQESTNRKFIDFRNMTIYPESADILCSDESVYLQPNLTKEKYSDVEHYLDIQFRLLREDYIRPLRSSIAEYRQRRLLESQQQTVAAFNANHPPSEIMRNTSARIYENIKFIYEDVDESTQNSRRKKNNIMDSAFIVCFASKKDKKFKNMDWEHNQRFMLGSLLCFSSDNFKTLIFATVLERDVRVLEQGKLRITLCKEQQLISFQDRYTMVESEVFFTPYYFVLKTLQKMTEQKFPFPEYFLRLDPSDSPPSYLTKAPHCDQVRYTLLINGNSVEMRVLERATWPSAQSLRLHNAQYDALYAALTTELVIIQGPPGTGKTFIGLKIAETLVQNKFAASRTTPILVIALSNHALDQFLVGMLKFTDKIIRIGGQSRNPVLSAYNLTGKRSPTQSKEVRNLWSHVKRLETQMESLLSDIKNLQSIASRGTLGPDMLDKEANHLIPMKVLEDLINGEFMSWLLKIENSHGLEILGLKYYMPFDELLNEINKCLDCYLQRYRIKLDDRGENFTEKSRFLIQNFISYMNLELQRTRTSIQEARKRAFNLQDFEVVKHCDVVGMTTTAGARLQELLRMLNPEIVIIEEAAEVMEAHIIACITKKCQHLILIGDHKQLRPKVSSYELEIDYNFSVSLFERMILTRGKCVTLTEQHRMAPQIAQLVTPSIYTTLTNAPNVITYSEIFGLEKRLFFIDHTIPEKTMEDTNSRKNEHEASFLLSLCEYLIMQGYHPSQITILSTYKGQMQHIKKTKKDREDLKGVLVQVVDNYQGEENDIILLSLVRSNRRNEIGFLKTENRVCVALTRAKLGMYMIGNMTCLSASAIWMKMKCTLERQRALGTGLPLRCRLHTTKISIVATSSDFQTKSPFGGCTLQCGYPLPCSHICTRTCHPNNQDHSNYKCRSPCENICPYNHPCQKFCFEICGDCTVQVPKVRSCSHEYVLECGVDEERIRCMKPCPKKLPCLHPCTKKCFENCAICTRLVQKERSCGHFYPLMCSDDPEYVKCLMPCSRNLRCNHKCQRKCWEECMPCEENVEKTRSCGHTYKLKCFENPEQIKCLQPCTLTLKCSHKCQHKCWEKCEPCEVPVKKTLRCAHNQQVKCFEDPEQVKCLMPCTRTLKCNHPCQRQCWEKCKPCEVTVTGTRSCGHIYTKYCSTDLEKLFCSEKCAKTLICDHKCARLCSENCDPCEVLETRKRTCGHVVYNVSCCTSQESLEQRLCRKRCSKNLNCGHSCMKECWEECPPCMKPVLKKATCGHELKVSCFIEIPQRKFCFNPCQVELSCGHQCANTCNKPCTEVCKVEVQGRRACSHVALFECWELEKGLLEPSKNGVCSEMCKSTLICGHLCPGTCVECHQGRFHTSCIQNCERTLPCLCKNKCTYVCGLLCPPCRNNFCSCTHQPPCTRIGPNNAPCMKAMNSVIIMRLRRLKKVTEELLNTLTQRSSVASFFVRVFNKETYTFIPFEELATSVTQVRECLTDSRQKHDITNVKIMEISVSILSRICKVWNTCCRVNPGETSINELKSYATFLLYLLRKEKIGNLWHINEQRVADFTLELERLQKMAQYFCLMSLVGPTEGLQPQYVTLIKRLCLLVFSFKQRFTAEKISESAELFRQVYMLLKIEKPVEIEFGKVVIYDTSLAMARN